MRTPKWQVSRSLESLQQAFDSMPRLSMLHYGKEMGSQSWRFVQCNRNRCHCFPVQRGPIPT